VWVRPFSKPINPPVDERKQQNSNMGMVFGKTGVAEPAYKVLATVNNSSGTTTTLPYEIRQYGQRFVAETEYTTGPGSKDSTSSPFRLLARYIGVFGEAANEGGTKMSMTAPVSMKEESSGQGGGGGGTKIAMAAPVSMKEQTSNDGSNNKKVMQFFLPDNFTCLEDIPVPTNPAVHIRAVPGATGAVHRFAGSMDADRSRALALQLGAQLRQEFAGDESSSAGAAATATISDDYVLEHYEYWGYNPPFTLPMFRRNEIWLELDEAAVEYLVKKNGGQQPSDSSALN